MPEKYEPIIFNTYHDSLLVGHQGPYHTAMTIRQKFFIHSLMNKEIYRSMLYLCHDLKEDLMGTKFFIIFVKYVVYDWG